FTYPVQFQAGDRVVVHLGVHTLNDDDDPFSSKLYYGGSGDDLETGDTDFSKPGWVHLPVSEDVTFQDPVDTSTPPGTEFDLSRWHLTTPADGGDGEAEQIDQPELNSYASEFFYLDDQNRMVCHAPVDGYTTSGESGATRTELREHEADYENSAWDPRTTALRSLTLTTQADATNISGGTEPRQEMIIWQVHGDGGTPPLYLAAEYHVSTPRIRLYASDPFFGSDGDYRDNPVVGITPDSFITIKCEVEQGEVRLWVIQGQVEDLPSSPTYTFPVSGFSDVPNWYFKAGAYNKTAIESGSTGYSEARISYLELIQPDQEPIVYTNRFFLAG